MAGNFQGQHTALHCLLSCRWCSQLPCQLPAMPTVSAAAQVLALALNRGSLCRQRSFVQIAVLYILPITPIDEIQGKGCQPQTSQHMCVWFSDHRTIAERPCGRGFSSKMPYVFPAASFAEAVHCSTTLQLPQRLASSRRPLCRGCSRQGA